MQFVFLLNIFLSVFGLYISFSVWTCLSETHYYPVVEDASPLTWSREHIREWGAPRMGRGAREDFSMRCDALLQPTHLDYGELW